MTNLTESSNWMDGIPQIDVGDWVEGGPDGVDNAPHQALANRTRFLKAAVESLSTGKASTVHSHAISDISGLQGALDGKAPTSHSHTVADVGGLQGALNGKADSTHAHAIADVNGLQGALDGKAASAHSHAISDVAGLQNALDGKTAKGHHHADSEIDSLAWSKLTGGGSVPTSGIPMTDATGTYAIKLSNGVLIQVKQ